MRALLLLAVSSIALLAACSSKVTPAATTGGDAGADAVTADTRIIVDTFVPDVPIVFVDPFVNCTRDPGPPADIVVPPSDAGADPIGGAEKFTMEMALAGFPATSGKLVAGITTQKGVIVCRLDETKAPITVANFVGLARGTRPFLDPNTGQWTLRRFYDGLKWHRVIQDFVIQGGDPQGTGGGGPGYDLVKENWAPQLLGTLAQAASTAPSGSQYFIVIGSGPAPNYNVFGDCDTDVAEAIGMVETNASDAPRVRIHMQKIDFGRCP